MSATSKRAKGTRKGKTTHIVERSPTLTTQQMNFIREVRAKEEYFRKTIPPPNRARNPVLAVCA